MAKVKVPVAGTIGKTISFDPDATVGATLGTNLFAADGSLLTIADIAAAITEASITPDVNTGSIFETDIIDGTLLARVADDETVEGAWTFNSLLVVQGPFASVRLTDTDAATDEKVYDWLNASGRLQLRTLNDDLSVADIAIEVTRTGNVIDGVDIQTALTAVSYDGILAANLLDKTVAETITESWIWSGSADTITFTGGGPMGVQFRSTGSTTAQQIDLLYRTSPDTLAFERTSDAIKIIEINAATLAVDFGATITATSYGGILEANLLDKSANETIAGIYTFSASPIITGTGGVIVQNIFPTYQFRETDAAVDNGNWWFIVNGEQFDFQIINDIFTVSTSIFTVQRTGTVVDSFDILAPLTAVSYGGILEANLLEKVGTPVDNELAVWTGDGTLEGESDLTFTGGSLNIGGPFSAVRLTDTDAATDEGIYDFLNATGVFKLRTLNDALSVASVIIKIDRTGVTPDFLGFMEGIPVRIYDGTGADFMEQKHDGTNFLTDFTNTTDWNISGANLRIVNNIGFYNTAPVAQPTGVAVTAAGIHAALVTLGLITA